MKKSIIIKCPSDFCDKKKQFPISVELSNNEEGVRSLQVKCIYCEKTLTVEFNEKIKPGEITNIHRGT